MKDESRSGAPRVSSPNRSQLLLQPTDLERIISDDHPARGVWDLVEHLDLSSYYDEIAARGSEPGRPATDPRVLLALWIFANSEGVGSARLLERLCERDAPYQWICGGVSVNHHTLSDFRTGHGAKIDALLTQTLAALMKQGVVVLRRVAQDGTKIRASASAASFRRRQSLERCLEEAREQVRKLKRELADDGGASTRRERAARERAAVERQAAIEAALEEIPKLEEKRAATEQRGGKQRKTEIRASTTDADCRVMKMADGGFRPAYNVQLATDASGYVVGVDVTNNGTDQPHVAPMLDDIKRRTAKAPEEYLVDGGFVTFKNIEVLAERGATVYAPVPKPKNENIDRYEPKRSDSPPVAAWRRRMNTEDAKCVYRQRAMLAERTNADLKAHRGLDRLNVRGLAKVKAVVLLAVLSFNLMGLLRGGLY